MSSAVGLNGGKRELGRSPDGRLHYKLPPIRGLEHALSGRSANILQRLRLAVLALTLKGPGMTNVKRLFLCPARWVLEQILPSICQFVELFRHFAFVRYRCLRAPATILIC